MTLNEAIQLHRNGDLTKAEIKYKTILTQERRHPDALNLLSNIYQQRGDFSQAVTLITRAIKQQPKRPDLYSNLGSALRGLLDFPAAITAFNKALSYQPDHFESLFNLANTYFDNNDLAKAVQTFEKAISLQPKFSASHELLSRVYSRMDNHSTALSSLEKALSLAPKQSNLYLLKGDLLQKTKQILQAIDAYNMAISLEPSNAKAHNNLGNALVLTNRLHDSISSYQKAIEHDPELNQAYVNLSWVFKEHGMLDQDIECLTTYLTLNPHSAQTHSDLLFSMNYHPAYSPEEHLTAARQWWKQHAPHEDMRYTHSPSTPTNRKLTVGFLSPDFRKHPVGTFILPLLTSLTGKYIQINCYAEMTNTQHDSVTENILKHTENWFSTHGTSAKQAAEKIYNDQVDILIDLAGHSAGNRLDIMALKPAPVQISWLGYVNTTGLPVIDYRITDQIADPLGAEKLYSEQLIRLPNSFFCFAPSDQSPEVQELPAKVYGNITFGSLNNIAKISEEVIKLWAEIIVKVKESKLIMVGRQFNDPFIKNRYLALFSKFGVTPERIDLLSELPMAEYLELYNKIDIALDPFPHNGHTITCHTLWMGVPVIVLAGQRYAARMGASVLQQIGLPDLIATSQNDYVQCAVNLAANLENLAGIRRELRSKFKRSKLYDKEQFAADFIETMNLAWLNWCKSTP